MKIHSFFEGVDVNGSLVLVKYGYTFRGMKVFLLDC